MAIFDDNDFDEVGHKHSTIKMQDTFNITATTVSPLMQMDQNGEQRKRFILVNGVYFNEPFLVLMVLEDF